MNWIEGPPPSDLDGEVIMVILDPKLLAEQFPGELSEYYDDPVACRWWSKKGKTTFGIFRINPELVLRWAKL